MIDQIPVKGNVSLRLISQDGDIKQEIRKNNLIVNIGRDGIADQLLPSPTIGKPSHMQLGEGTSAPSLPDSDLESPIGDRKVLGVVRTSNDVVYTSIFGPNESTGAITEAGIFNASSGGGMYARIVFDVINKGENDTLEVEWTWTIGS